MIHYWQFNIQQHPETEGKISNKILAQFDQILNSDNTNKRKIDLLHTLLERILGEKFRDVKLNFEEYFFNNVLPDYLENPVLSELVKLDPIFITSNYDFEIENHLKRSKQKDAFKSINNINEFVTFGKELRSGDVLHLHGTTNGNWDLFVNATIDYSRQYLKQTEDFRSLSDWFSKRKPVVLFLGSSMEEEEILSLLPMTTTNFALMKANSKETNEFREIYNQIYQKNNTTKIFWYGDTYEDLPKKVKDIVSEVQKILEVPTSIEDWNNLHSVSLNDTIYREIFEKYSEDSRFLFDIFKTEDRELQNKILKNSLDSEILIGKIIKLDSFWEMLNKAEKLNDNQLSKIIKIFQDEEFNIYSKEIFNFFEKLKINKSINIKELEKIKKSLSKNEAITWTSFSTDPDIMGYWLVEQLKNGNRYSRNIYIDKEIIYSINIKNELLPVIVNATNEESVFRFSSYKDLMSDELIEMIYESLLNNKLFLENEEILKNFPDELLKSRLFQRILVNMALTTTLESSLIDMLVKSIDFTDTIFGSELNNFISKFESKITEFDIELLPEYKDGFGEVEGGSVREHSFISSNELMSNDTDSILKILLKNKKNEREFTEDFLIEKTFSATSNFLLKTLKMGDEASKKVKDLIISKGTLLYEKYEKLFVSIVIDIELDEDFKSSVFDILLKEFSLDTFSYDIKDLVEYYIDNEQFDSPIFRKLLDVNVKSLDTTYIYVGKERPEILEVDDFINTELGRYLDVVIRIVKKDRFNISQIEDLINNIESIEFKDFTKGALYLQTNNKPIEKITINTFEGYSYSLRGFRKEDLINFEEIGKFILNKGFVSRFNKINLFILSLQLINPKENSINWNQINFSSLISLVLKSEYNYPFEEEWLEEIVKQDNEGKYGTTIFHLIGNSESNVDKLKIFYRIFEKSIKNYPSKISIGLLPKFIEELNNESKKELLLDAFFLLLDNQKILSDPFVSRVPIELLKHMNHESQKQLANHRNLPTFLSPLEIEDLKRKI